MNAVLGIAALYVIVCAILPSLVARLRGHDWRGELRVFAVGLLLGWTGYGALAAWIDAMVAPDAKIIIR
jgi:hypothetical protein